MNWILACDLEDSLNHGARVDVGVNVCLAPFQACVSVCLWANAKRVFGVCVCMCVDEFVCLRACHW